MSSIWHQSARRASLVAIFVAGLAILVWQNLHAGGLRLPGSSQHLSVQSNRQLKSTGIKVDQWSLTTVTSAYRTYEQAASAEIKRMRSVYSKLSTVHQRLASGSISSLDYPLKLGRLEQAMHANSIVTGAIADLAIREVGVNETEVNRKNGEGGSIFRAREALLHFVRDWSDEGAEERSVIFGPILDVLRSIPEEHRDEMKVLVPGSGLGRLAWEISQLGMSLTCLVSSSLHLIDRRYTSLKRQFRLQNNRQRTVLVHEPSSPILDPPIDHLHEESAYDTTLLSPFLEPTIERPSVSLGAIPRRRALVLREIHHRRRRLLEIDPTLRDRRRGRPKRR